MQGSTIEAMSAAVEDAAVICYGISMAYKESANCRLEAQYAMQQRKSMIPLLLEEKYRPTGWLGMLLGVHLWFGFFGQALASEAAFEQKVGELCRELEAVVQPEDTQAGAAPASEPEPQPRPRPPPQSGSQCAAVVAEGVPPLSPSLMAAASPRRADCDLWTTPATQLVPMTTTRRHDAPAAPAAAADDDSFCLHLQGELRELRAENQQLRHSLQSLQGQLGTLECLTADGLAALQQRLRRLREGELLTAQEGAALHDSLADFVAASPCLLGQYCTAGGVAHRMARLSEAFAEEDGGFARQLRRKCL
jgi:hypothetical protein